MTTATNTSNVDFAPVTIQSSHPYYLHPLDSPEKVLVASKFNGTGYGEWRRTC